MADVGKKMTQNWDNRELIQNVQYNILQIARFLNKFDNDAKCKLAKLNHSLFTLERQMELIEARISGVGESGEAEASY